MLQEKSFYIPYKTMEEAKEIITHLQSIINVHHVYRNTDSQYKDYDYVNLYHNDNYWVIHLIPWDRYHEVTKDDMRENKEPIETSLNEVSFLIESGRFDLL